MGNGLSECLYGIEARDYGIEQFRSFLPQYHGYRAILRMNHRWKKSMLKYLILLILIILLSSCVFALKKGSQKQSHEDQEGTKSKSTEVKVWFDKESAWVHWPSKKPESIRWDSLIGVAVETTDQGPLVEDVYWHLASEKKVITYPSEATGTDDLLKRLQELPTFNNERLIEAMTCTDNRTFILWDHEGRHK